MIIENVMNMKSFIKVFVIIIVCISVMMSCKTEKQIVADITPVELVGSETYFNDTLYLADMHEVKLECNAKSILNTIGKIIEIDDNIYILDVALNQIVIFDSCGNYINTINHVGRGRGEYIHLVDMTYDKSKDEIVCLVDPSALIYYKKNGTHIRTERLDGYYTDIFADTSYIYLYNSTYANAKIPEYTIECINKQTGIKTNLLEFQDEYAPFCSMGAKMFGNGDGMYFVRKFDNNIYHVAEGDIDGIYELNLKDYSFPQEKLDRKYECDEIFRYCKKNKYAYMFTNLIFGDSYVMFSSNLFDMHVISTVEKKDRHYSYMNVTKYNIPTSLYRPVESSKKRCCFILKPVAILNLKKLYNSDERMRKNISADFIKYTENITMDSNPILLFYNIR